MSPASGILLVELKAPSPSPGEYVAQERPYSRILGTSAGADMVGTLGVATLAYMPWAISNWIAIFFALVWAATGIGIAKLTPEEQNALEAEG